MNKKEFISQLTSLVEGYTEGLRNANNKLFHSEQKLTAEKQKWEQKYHSAMAANKRLEERNEGLMVEKQALLDVISEWKNENHSLTALNATLSEELQKLKKDREALLRTIQNREKSYLSVRHELDLTQKKLAEDNAEKLRLHCLLQSRTEELAAAEEKHEEFKKRSDEILATMEENLQKKQEQIEALTVWKTGVESALDTLEKELKNAIAAGKVHEGTIELLVMQKQELSENLHALKQINSFQEHRIEVLARKANKMRKKEQND